MYKALLAVSLSLFLTSFQALAEEVWPSPDWRVADDSSTTDWREVQAYAFADRDDSRREGVRTDALLVIKDGRIVYEHYAAPTTANTPHLTWSISKSVLAAVLGVAYGEGRFHLNDPVAGFYPPMQSHPHVRLEDLLHWASGLNWQENYEYAPLHSSVVAMLYTRGRGDMAAFTAARPAAETPGQRFLYSSGDSNLLAAALRAMLPPGDYAAYPWDALFTPLGIESAVWEKDTSGTFVGSSYLYMNARDLARIGLLMLRNGRWHAQQVVPQDWVAFNRKLFDKAVAEPGEANPGGHWWLNQPLAGGGRPWPDAPADTFAALGHWGQALYVLPQKQMIVVRYADDRDGRFQHNELLKRVLAAQVEGQP
ncbi:serine hydrolase [Pseudomonas sp. DG56-2]|uniref:serine hydrolase domain-containing protein n=1 Tax=Pseudomonas sp. DG56-2 TaxID=2320270 RepID=UPI0010A690A6|nr:serine hydrolase [Pseudomonas sp. DG56-2]